MGQHRINKGLNIPIAGAAKGDVVELDRPSTVHFDPREFNGLIPRLAAREGDVVKRGQPLFFHKFNPELVIVSPVEGRVTAVTRGKRRVITDVAVEVTGDEAVTHKAWTLGELAGIDAAAAKEQLLASGLFAFLRTRPLDYVATPDQAPSAILISATETGPLQPGADVLLSADDKDAFQAGVHVLKAVAAGAPVHLTTAEGSSHPALSGVQGITESHSFSGPHPAGDPGVQINHVCPVPDGRKAWYIRAWDVARIGRSFLSGSFDASAVYAAVGTGLTQPRYVRTVLGAPAGFVAGGTVAGPLRWIRGSVLTGGRISEQAGAGFYTRAVHVMKDEVPREFLGWALPKPSKFSIFRAYLSGFSTPSKAYDLLPGMNGGHRAIVPSGAFRKVVASPDLEPLYLFKAIISGDLEESLRMGLLDISMEEAALCTYVDPCKNEYDVLLGDFLAYYAKEA